MEFREQAMQVYRKEEARRQAEEAEDLVEQQERAACRLAEKFGIDVERIEPGEGRTLVVDGEVVFGFYVQWGAVQNGFGLIGECPHCGDRIQSNRVGNLDRIGRYLVSLEEGDLYGWDHFCMEASEPAGPSNYDHWRDLIEDLEDDIPYEPVSKLHFVAVLALIDVAENLSRRRVNREYEY